MHWWNWMALLLQLLEFQSAKNGWIFLSGSTEVLNVETTTVATTKTLFCYGHSRASRPIMLPPLWTQALVSVTVIVALQQLLVGVGFLFPRCISVSQTKDTHQRHRICNTPALLAIILGHC